MRLLTSKIAVLFGIIFLLASCIKKKEFNVVPELTFQNYTVFYDSIDGKFFGDSAYLTFAFTDGDGDLGSDDESVESLFMSYYEDDGNGFVHQPDLDRAVSVPKLTSNGNNKGIEGTFLQIIKTYPDVTPVYNYKTPYPYKWKLMMVDRAGHKSNVIETPPQTK
ncbi:MAG: hypothetical protein NT150_10365 [Bacteroidetes bacterium]|nr:hypothetical protein [Bacteroidota bacterium]